MGLLKIFIRRDLAELHQSGVRFASSATRENLRPTFRALLMRPKADAAIGAQSRYRLQLWRRDEIARAARKLVAVQGRTRRKDRPGRRRWRQ
jgi:undecaprenyl diphosphate synthase